jgi:hypothetical protein
MSSKKILVAGLLGAVIAFILGAFFYGFILNDFFSEHAGSATGVTKANDDFLWGYMVIGHLAWGYLFAIIYSRWANISNFRDGATIGVVLGLLIGITFDAISLGSTNVLSLVAAIVDVIVMIVNSAVIGGVVGWYLGMGKTKE